jgi:hypothetical protein
LDNHYNFLVEIYLCQGKKGPANFLILLFSLTKFANEIQRELAIVIKIFVVRNSTELIIRFFYIATFIFTAVLLSFFGEKARLFAKSDENEELRDGKYFNDCYATAIVICRREIARSFKGR